MSIAAVGSDGEHMLRAIAPTDPHYPEPMYHLHMHPDEKRSGSLASLWIVPADDQEYLVAWRCHHNAGGDDVFRPASLFTVRTLAQILSGEDRPEVIDPYGGSSAEKVLYNALAHYDKVKTDETPPFNKLALLVCVHPRYKQSHASGDEWRVTYYVHFVPKPSLDLFDSLPEHQKTRVRGSLCEVILRSMPLIREINWEYEMVCNEQHGPYPGYERLLKRGTLAQFTENVCSQVGCHERCDVIYHVKKPYQVNGEEYEADQERWHRDRVYVFCRRHETRGDCGLEDCDKNLEKMWDRNDPTLIDAFL